MVPLLTSPFITAGPLASLTFYLPGTSTLATVYTDPAQTTPSINPIRAGMTGRFPSVYVAGLVRVVLKDSAGQIIQDVDRAGGIAIGSADITYQAPGSGSVTRSVAAKLGESVSILDGGAKGDNLTLGNSAKINAMITSGVTHIRVPPGEYLLDETVNLVSGVILDCDQGAVFKAASNGLTMLKADFNGYYSAIWNLDLQGNGHTGVIGYDVRNFGIGGGLLNCTVSHMETGFISRGGNFSTQLLNFTALDVHYPIDIMENSSVIDIIHPVLDNKTDVGGDETGIGIQVRSGGGSNLGVRIIGGYVQGFAIGVLDAGIGTKITDTYFEVCSDVDVDGQAARAATYSGLQHWADVGGAAYRLRNCDAVTIFNPTMGSGGRPVLYDVDASNSNCVEYRTLSNASYDFPTGSLEFLGSLPVQTSGSFLPVIKGSTSAGSATYTTQAGRWSRTGNVGHFNITVSWSGHDGTGALVVSGLADTLSPKTYTPDRPVSVKLTGIAFTGPLVDAYFNGSTTDLTVRETSIIGATTLLAVPAAGSISLSGSWEI